MSIGSIGGPSGFNTIKPLFNPAGSPTTGAPASTAVSGSTTPQGASFQNSLLDAIREVNDIQLQADEMARALAAGQAAELHQVMLAAEKANLSLQFTLQVRNKIIDAYQEIMRMQV